MVHFFFWKMAGLASAERLRPEDWNTDSRHVLIIGFFRDSAVKSHANKR
jgi:hypothetical protein